MTRSAPSLILVLALVPSPAEAQRAVFVEGLTEVDAHDDDDVGGCTSGERGDRRDGSWARAREMELFERARMQATDDRRCTMAVEAQRQDEARRDDEARQDRTR